MFFHACGDLTLRGEDARYPLNTPLNTHGTLLGQGVSVHAVSYRHLLRRVRDHTLLWETAADYNWCRIYFWYPEKYFVSLLVKVHNNLLSIKIYLSLLICNVNDEYHLRKPSFRSDWHYLYHSNIAAIKRLIRVISLFHGSKREIFIFKKSCLQNTKDIK